MIVLDTDAVLTVLLLFMRVFVFVFLLPIFGTFFVPNTVKVYLALAIAFSLFSFAELEPVKVDSTAHFIQLATSELAFGFLTGFFLRLIFDAVFIAGELIAVSTGLGFLTMFLPQQPQTTVLAGFSTLLSSTLFLSVGGAEAVYVGFVNSLGSVPLGSFNVYSLNGEVFIKLFYESFSTGVKIAFPVILASLITNIILAIINRFIPQINVFMVGLPLQVAVGLVVFALSMPVIGLVLISEMRDYVFEFLEFMNHR